METETLRPEALMLLDMLPLRISTNSYNYGIAMDLKDMGLVTINGRVKVNGRVSYLVTRR